MIELKDNSKRLSKEYLKQDFHEYVRSNGECIMVSSDYRYFYRPLL